MMGLLANIQTVTATPDSAIDFSWLFVKMLFLLGIVSVFAVLILKYVVPKLSMFKRSSHPNAVNILFRHTLEPRKQLYCVHIASKYLLLGITDQQISMITELTKDDVDLISGVDIDKSMKKND